MSNLIATDSQSQEISSGLIELFQITLPTGETLYFHPGLNEDLDEVKFRDKNPPSTSAIVAGSFIVGNSYTIVSGTGFTSIGSTNDTAGTVFIATGVGTGTGTATQNDHSIREYSPMPMMVDGLDVSADGAPARPALTIANIGTLFSSQLGGFKNDDLVGQRLIRRQTFVKYLHGQSGDASPPVEFRTQEYIIDRIAAENATAISFEVAAPFDLEGIQLPRRVVVGKYCSWNYQGHDSGKGGGCTWKQDNSYTYKDSNGDVYTHHAYFDFEERPLVVSTTSFGTYGASTAHAVSDYVTHGGKKWLCIIAGTGNTPSATSSHWKEVFVWSAYTSSASYSSGARVRSGGTIWKSLHDSNLGNTPTHGRHWVRDEVCGKTLQSCKARYGAIPVVQTSADKNPSGRTNRAARLPFGSFPGTLKY